MTADQWLAAGAAGIAAGIINAVAGGASLVTFPVFVWIGLSPLSANVTNCVGMVPGNFSAAWGFRHELASQGPLLRRIAPASILGSLTGGALLLALPATLFARIAPVLVALASVLTLLQPQLQRRVAQSRDGRSRRLALHAGVFLISIYGGYFGAGIGMLFTAVLALTVAESLHRLTAAKTILQGIANGCAALVFCCVAPVDWRIAILLAITGSISAPFGAWIARRMRPDPLRYAIGGIGLLSAAFMAARYR